MEGTVKFFNRIKGFGFINGDDGKDYFVHITGIKDKGFLNENDRVRFEGKEDEKGPKASEVEVIGKTEQGKKAAPEEESKEGPSEEPEEEQEEDENEEGEEE